MNTRNERRRSDASSDILINIEFSREWNRTLKEASKIFGGVHNWNNPSF